MMSDYGFSAADLEETAEAIRTVVPATPQYAWPLLCSRVGAEVWVKHENHTPTGAFKLRGGVVYTDDLRRREPGTAGVIAATRGNHGQSVACAAARAGMTSVVVVPHGNSVEKNAAMAAQGAELVVHGADFQEALEHAQQLADERGLHMFPSFHPLLVRGVATYAWELMSAVSGLDAVYVPIGLGSGICGVIAARDALGCRAEVVGVVSDHAPTYALSFEAGRPVSTNTADTMADGMACRVPVSDAVDIIRAGADRVVRVTDTEVRAAIRHLYTDTHNVAEGAGAAPFAALLQERRRMAGKRVGVILSGGNIDRTIYRDILAEPDRQEGTTA